MEDTCRLFGRLQQLQTFDICVEGSEGYSLRKKLPLVVEIAKLGNQPLCDHFICVSNCRSRIASALSFKPAKEGLCFESGNIMGDHLPFLLEHTVEIHLVDLVMNHFDGNRFYMTKQLRFIACV